MASVLGADPSHDFLAADGGIGELISTRDWSRTPLGPVEGWPPALKIAVNPMLASPGPVTILWGPERVRLYNDAYVPIAAERHPDALGRPASLSWSEAYGDFWARSSTGCLRARRSKSTNMRWRCALRSARSRSASSPAFSSPSATRRERCWAFTIRWRK